MTTGADKVIRFLCRIFSGAIMVIVAAAMGGCGSKIDSPESALAAIDRIVDKDIKTHVSRKSVPLQYSTD